MPDLFQSPFACRCMSCSEEVGETYSREYLRACPVRSVAKSHTRAPFLRKYAEHHGQAGAERLADEIREELRKK